LQQQEKVISILVAKKEIPAGSPIEPDYVEKKSFSETKVTLDAVTSLDRIQGMVTIANILQNEPITITKLAFPQGAAGLASVTPVGRRAISISVDNIAAVAGMVKPGDFVDVIVLISFPVQLADGKQMTDTRLIPLFQNVEVLAVGQSTVGAGRTAGRYTQEEPKETKPQSPLITLSLTPKEAGILAYISETGKIRLILRNPQDSKMEPLEITSLESILRYLSPQQAEKQEIPKPTNFVEIYRGLAKEKVPLRD
jgi:pilus assembly protein CpaB